MNNLNDWLGLQWPGNEPNSEQLKITLDFTYSPIVQVHFYQNWLKLWPKEMALKFQEVLLQRWLPNIKIAGIDYLESIQILSQEGPGPSLSEKEAHIFLQTFGDAVGTEIQQRFQFEEMMFLHARWINYPKYKLQRLEMVEKMGWGEACSAWIVERQPRIGVYAGSFNPFHLGHLNVLQKAEKVFDKVILAIGKNPDKKETEEWPIPSTLASRQIEQYGGLLTDFIAGLGYPVTLIRGLRNSTDFHYEQNQFRYLCELLPEIQVVNIFCDKEFEHISSSGIRTLSRYGAHLTYLVP